MQSLYFKGVKDCHTSTLKAASPLKGDKMWSFKRLQATFKL